METIKNFFANKKIGYYLVILDVILAVFLGIFFFLTYKVFPSGYGGQGMASSAYASVPEVIGLFMFLGAVVDIVALLLPEYLPIHLLAIGAYCVSLMKQVYCIPNLVADEVNNVHYQGGSFPLCLSWLIITFVILIAAIAVMFLGMIAQDEESAKMREKPAGAKIIKIGAGAGAIIASLVVVLVIYGTTADAIKKGSAASDVATFEQRVKARAQTFADKVLEYNFDPAEFGLTEEDNQYSANKGAISGAVGTYSRDQNRDGFYRVYTFEGSTAEGWQGDYSQKYVRFTLWSDGLFNGNINGSDLTGYWYNRDEDGNECLVMMSSDGSNDMVGDKLKGQGAYYEWLVDARASYNGGRMIKGNGCKYYPLIGMFVDTGSEETPEFKVGSEFTTSGWTCMQVRNNLVAASIFDAEHEVTFSSPDMSTAGTKTVKARWRVQGPIEESAKEYFIKEGNNYYLEDEIEINVVE